MGFFRSKNETTLPAAAVPSTQSFISRLAVVLVVSGLAASGYAIVMPPPLRCASLRASVRAWIFGGLASQGEYIDLS